MKLHLTTASQQNLISAYHQDYIEINQQRYFANLIVLPDQLEHPWYDGSFEALSTEKLAILGTIKPEVVLLGTGEQHRFLHPKHLAQLTELHIPVECMTTAAACRTYNILMSEGRKVAAALILR
jgi:uncharacterized protein